MINCSTTTFSHIWEYGDKNQTRMKPHTNTLSGAKLSYTMLYITHKSIYSLVQERETAPALLLLRYDITILIVFPSSCDALLKVPT